MRRWAAAVAVALAVIGSPPAGADADALQAGSVAPAPVVAHVHALHRTFLGRDARTDELAPAAFTVHRHGPAALARSLATSPEWAGTRIAELYQRVLGREPDPGGLDHWVDAVRRGLALEAIAASFHGSEEYLARSGGTPGGFVDALYRDLLHRASDDAGHTHWTGVLAGGTSRTTVAAALLDSRESRADRVARLYRAILERAPDPTGRAHWEPALSAVGDLALASFLAASDELHRRVTGLPLPVVTTEPVGPGTAFPLTASFRAGCPVGPDQLVALRFPHRTFAGGTATGVLIVHRDIAADAATLVRAAYGYALPIGQARPVDDFGGDDDASMAADNSSGFNCRTVAGSTTLSQHAFGRAVDLNPIENPALARDGTVAPPAGSAFLDRGQVRPGMLVVGAGVIDTADRLGWGWGGRWTHPDWQHLSSTGR